MNKSTVNPWLKNFSNCFKNIILFFALIITPPPQVIAQNNNKDNTQNFKAKMTPVTIDGRMLFHLKGVTEFSAKIHTERIEDKIK